MGGNERATAFCPFHKDEKSKSFSINLKTGQWHCFSGACGQKGNVLTFARRLKITPPQWAGGKNYMGVYVKLQSNDRGPAREYLLRRGISIDYINYLSINNLFVADEYQNQAFLTFPIFDIFGHVCALNKVNIETGQKLVYGNYKEGYWIDLNFSFEGHVYLVEGVINALTLNMHGFSAMSLITAGNSIDSTAFLNMKKITLMFDNDIAGRKAARRISRELSEDSCPVYSINWPLDCKKGFDPNDILQIANNSQEFLEALDNRSRIINEWGDYTRFRRLVSERRKHNTV